MATAPLVRHYLGDDTTSPHSVNLQNHFLLIFFETQIATASQGFA